MNDDRPTVPRRTYLRAVTGITAAGMTALAGCQEANNSAEASGEGATGRLTTRIALDSTAREALKSCSVTVDGLLLVPATDGDSGESDTDSDGNGSATESGAEDIPEPEHYAFDEPQTMALVDPGPDDGVLDTRDLPPGSYQSLLLDVSAVAGTLRNGRSAAITVLEDEPFQFFAPFEIRTDTTTTFVAGVAPDGRESTDGYALRPFSDGTTVSYGDDGNERVETDDADGSQEPIEDRLDVVHAVGHVSPAETVTTVELTVKKSAGTDAIDLSALTLEFSDGTTEATLSHGGNEREDATANTFVTTRVAGDGSHDELASTADRVTITFDASLARGDDGLPPGSSAAVALVDSTGARYVYEASVPSTFGEKDVVPV